jgi:hypothetical protein
VFRVEPDVVMLHLLSTPIENATETPIENATLGGGDEA